MQQNPKYFTFSKGSNEPLGVGPIDFTIGSMACIGNFQNALEGAVVGPLGSGPTTGWQGDMFLPTAPGLWRAARLFNEYEGDDGNIHKAVSGLIVWNAEHVGGIEEACQYTSMRGEYASSVRSEILGRYGWMNFRDPREHKDWPQGARIDDLMDSSSSSFYINGIMHVGLELNSAVFKNVPVFFCDPSVFLSEVVPVMRSNFRILRRLRKRTKKNWLSDMKIPSSFQLCSGLSHVGAMRGIVCNWSGEYHNAQIFFEKDLQNPAAVAMVVYSGSVDYVEKYPVDAPRWVLERISSGLPVEKSWWKK